MRKRNNKRKENPTRKKPRRFIHYLRSAPKQVRVQEVGDILKSEKDRKGQAETELRKKGTKRLSAQEFLDKLEEGKPIGEKLELVVLGVLRSKGWKAYLTPRGADGGIDIVGQKGINDRIKFAVQVKHWKANITELQVRDFWGACSGVYDEALFVMSSQLNRNAKKFIDKRKDLEGTRLRYWEGRQLRQEIDEMTDENYDVMQRLLNGEIASHLPKEGLNDQYSTASVKAPMCPKCGSMTLKRKNQRDGSIFYGCVRYPECRWTIDGSKVLGK